MRELLKTLETELTNLVAPIEKDQGKSFDTYRYNLNKTVNELGDQLQYSLDDGSFSEVLDLMDVAIDYDSILMEQKQKVLELGELYPKITVLFNMLSNTLQISPLVPILFFHDKNYLNQTRVVAKPMHRFAAIEALPPSEERADLVFGLYADVFEQSYKHYIHLVWVLWKISVGQSIKSKQWTPGLAIRDLKENAPEDFQSLILPDSAMIRNAENHQESTRAYVPPTDSFRWLDNKKHDLVHEYPVEYLLESAKEMYYLGAEGMLLIQNYFTMFFSVNLYRYDRLDLVKALKEENQEWLIAHEEDIQNRLLYLAEPLKGLGL